jgi:EAL domain-containing protein (putative c-di-GMP-specific phosphodiesterase class I)
MVLDPVVSQLRVDDFLEKIADTAIVFPQEFMLANGVILGLLGATCIGLFLTAIFKRSARALIALSFSAIGLVLLALLQGRIGPVSASGVYLLLALFAASGVLFLTATIRMARDNPVAGAVLLGSVVSVLVTGGGAMLGVAGFEIYVLLAVLGIGLLVPLIALFSLMSGDRAAMVILPGLLMIVGGFAAMRLGVSMEAAGNGWFDHWSGALLPMGLFSLGLVIASWAGALLRLAPQPEQESVDNFREPNLAPAFSADEASAEDPSGKPSDEQGREKFRFKDASPDKERRDLEQTKEPLFEHKGPDRREPVLSTGKDKKGEDRPEKNSDDTPELRSPTSALWGRSAAAAPVVLEDSVPDIAKALGVKADNHWDWAVTGRDQIAQGFAELLGIGREELTPEAFRGLIDERNLEIFDDEILGGSEPQSGDFSFPVFLKNGAKLELKGRRFVDEDGLVSRLVAFADESKSPKLIKRQKKQVTAAREDNKARATSLKSALDNQEIRAHFQPIVRVSDGEIAGFEALARWHKPGIREPLPANAFIGDAIDAGLGMEVARVIVDEAATELAAWLKEQPGQGQFVTINISAQDLVNNDFVKIVKQAIKKHNLPEGALVVELTESHVMENIGKANQVFKALKNAGAHIALDDFGAGHSSLSRLSKLNVDLLKTDRALLEELGTSKDASIVLQGAIDIAHRLGLKVIAEGAETEALARTLKSLGCDYGQGYFFGAAEPAGGPDAQEPEPEAGVAVNLR